MRRALCYGVVMFGVLVGDATLHAARPPVVTADDVRAMIVAEAVANRIVPPELALAVAREESNFNPGAESPAGARGVMQIMPATALGVFGVEPELLWNARVNVWIGVTHLEQLFSRYGQNWEAALSHYNGGALRSDGTGEPVPHRFTQAYVTGVMRRWNQYAVDPVVARLVANVRSGKMPAPSATAVRKPVRSAPAPAVVAVTGAPSARGLRGDMEDARASFRRALQARGAGK